MRQIKLYVGAKPIGTAITWAYPYGKTEYYIIPTYELIASGKDAKGVSSKASFEVIRFGVYRKERKGTAKVVGLADHQVHNIKAWLPYYSVQSASSPEKGAWQVYSDFLIHDGPDNPHQQLYASKGCVEICGGPHGFVKFNDYLIHLSGSTASKRSEQLKEIGKARNMFIEYEKALRPPLKKYQ